MLPGRWAPHPLGVLRVTRRPEPVLASQGRCNSIPLSTGGSVMSFLSGEKPGENSVWGRLIC